MYKIIRSKFINILLIPHLSAQVKKYYASFNEWANKKILNEADVDVVYLDDKIVGFLYTKLDGSYTLKISCFLTDKTYKGIGSLLIKRVDEISRILHVKFIYVTMPEKNTRLQNFFESNCYSFYGYRVTDDLVEKVYIKKVKEANYEL